MSMPTETLHPNCECPYHSGMTYLWGVGVPLEQQKLLRLSVLAPICLLATLLASHNIYDLQVGEVVKVARLPLS